MRILITGASGLLGLNLALELTNQHTVFGQVNRHDLHTNAFTVLKADLLEPGAVERLMGDTVPDCVIHCAALADLEKCEKNPGLAWELNTKIPQKLAENCRKGGARLVHISTDAVFDGQTGGYSEDDPPSPLSTYAKTKLNGEIAVGEAFPQAIIVRVNFFGWSLTGQRSLAEFFVNNLSNGTPVMGFTDVYFCPLLVNDMAPILIGMIEQELSGLYHVLSRDNISKYAFGVAIAHKFNLDADLIKPILVSDSGLTAARSPKLILKVEKLQDDLGEVLPNVSTGIDRFYTLYQQGYPQFIRRMAS